LKQSLGFFANDGFIAVLKKMTGIRKAGSGNRNVLEKWKEACIYSNAAPAKTTFRRCI
jgi:hypothetical protein